MRQALYPALDGLLSTIHDDLYAAYAVEKAEYVGTREAALDDMVAELREAGYESSGILAAAKYHHESGEVDDGSYRRVDEERPRTQWHVHLWETEEGVEVYSHYEYRPDLLPVADESLGEAIERAREHYSPSWGPKWDYNGTTYVLGAACDAVAERLGADPHPDHAE